MKNISEFFSKLQNKHSQELFVRKIISDAILKVAKVTVPPEAMTFKGGVLVLKGLDQAEKSEIYIKKTYILWELEANLKTRKISDIR